MYQAGVGFSNTLIELFDKVQLSDRFTVVTSQAGIHKLGCMLAITDQLTYDTKISGRPLSARLCPVELDSNWQEMFGESIPDLGGLYAQAHGVLVTYADSPRSFNTVFSSAYLFTSTCPIILKRSFQF